MYRNDSTLSPYKDSYRINGHYLKIWKFMVLVIQTYQSELDPRNSWWNRLFSDKIWDEWISSHEYGQQVKNIH